jgi:hypothetical protein
MAKKGQRRPQRPKRPKNHEIIKKNYQIIRLEKFKKAKKLG